MENVILAVVTLKTAPHDTSSLEELKRLAHTAGGTVVHTFQIRVQAFNSATLIGSGKMEDIDTLARNALKDTATKTNIVRPTMEDVKTILAKTYYEGIVMKKVTDHG